VGNSLTKSAVAEIKNDGARRAELLNDYIELSPAKRDATLIASGHERTNEGLAS
jgi:hypothetical protein